jgi:hypothetical protein
MTTCAKDCGNCAKRPWSAGGAQMCWDYAYKPEVFVSLESDVRWKEIRAVESELADLQKIQTKYILPELVPFVKRHIADLKRKLELLNEN